MIGLFQVASTCLKLVNVSNLSWLRWGVSQVVLHAFFFLSLLACLRLFLGAEYVMRFGWFYVFLCCFTIFFGELLQVVFICFNFLNVSGCSNCSLFEISLWYVPNCFILFFGAFRVV